MSLLLNKNPFHDFYPFASSKPRASCNAAPKESAIFLGMDPAVNSDYSLLHQEKITNLGQSILMVSNRKTSKFVLLTPDLNDYVDKVRVILDL